MDKQQPQGPHLDLKIAYLLAEQALYHGGFKIIQGAVDKSKDPGQAIGQFLFVMGQHIMDNTPGNIKLSPAILLAPGGWVEKVSDLIQEKLKVPKQIMDKAEIYIASTASHMAQVKQQQGAGSINGIPAPPVPAPGGPAPQGGSPAQAGPPVMPQPQGGGQ